LAVTVYVSKHRNKIMLVQWMPASVPNVLQVAHFSV